MKADCAECQPAASEIEQICFSHRRRKHLQRRYSIVPPAAQRSRQCSLPLAPGPTTAQVLCSTVQCSTWSSSPWVSNGMPTCTPVLEHGVQRLGAPVCSCRSPSGHSTGRSGWGSSCTRKRASCSQAARSLVGPAMAGVLHNQGEEVVALCCGARRGTCRSRLWQDKVACWQHGACQTSRGSNPVMMQASSPDSACCDPAAGRFCEHCLSWIAVQLLLFLPLEIWHAAWSAPQCCS